MAKALTTPRLALAWSTRSTMRFARISSAAGLARFAYHVAGAPTRPTWPYLGVRNVYRNQEAPQPKVSISIMTEFDDSKCWQAQLHAARVYMRFWTLHRQAYILARRYTGVSKNLGPSTDSDCSYYRDTQKKDHMYVCVYIYMYLCMYVYIYIC